MGPPKPRPFPPPWLRVLVACAGVGMVVAFAVDRVTSGKPGDPTLVSAGLVLTALGIGATLDWLRR